MITLAKIDWMNDTIKLFSFPAYKDSVDQAGTYSTGICGEKVVSLASDAPRFLSITADADPINNPWTIKYEKSQATVTNVGFTTIKYSVSFKEYDGITPSLEGTFDLEISCDMTSSLD